MAILAIYRGIKYQIRFHADWHGAKKYCKTCYPGDFWNNFRTFLVTKLSTNGLLKQLQLAIQVLEADDVNLI